MMINFENVDAYISSFTPEKQAILRQIREIILQAAPGVSESISYGMPAYKLHGVLVYFAAQKKHLGFYPTSSALNPFNEELAGYSRSKGTIRFPFDQPIPYALIRRIVEFRVAENQSTPSW